MSTPKVNPSPFGLRQSQTVQKTLPLTDSRHPDSQWDVTLVAGNSLTFHKAQSMTAVLVQRYLTGFAGRPPIPFPAVGGEPVEISEALFDQVSQIWAAQPGTSVPTPDDLDIHTGPNPWSCEEIIAIAAVAPEAWVQLLTGWAELQKSAEGKRSGASSRGTSSESRSDTPADIPSTLSEPMRSSAASMSD